MIRINDRAGAKKLRPPGRCVINNSALKMYGLPKKCRIDFKTFFQI